MLTKIASEYWQFLLTLFANRNNHISIHYLVNEGFKLNIIRGNYFYNTFIAPCTLYTWLRV